MKYIIKPSPGLNKLSKITNLSIDKINELIFKKLTEYGYIPDQQDILMPIPDLISEFSIFDSYYNVISIFGIHSIEVAELFSELKIFTDECPVCGHELISVPKYDYDNGFIIESSYKCENCNYTK
jgi:hypothetical protein